MKRLSIFFAALMAFTMSFAQTDYSKTYTSNATLKAGDNAFEAKIVIGGTSFDGMKAGTSSKAGTIKITVPANSTNLHIHAIAWKGATGAAVTITGATCVPASLTLADNSGITGNSPFTISGDMLDDYYFNVALTGITADTELTLSCDKRFVVFGVNAVATAEVPATAIALDQTTLELEQYKSAQLTATLTPAGATTIVTWTSSNEAVATISDKGVISALTTGTTTITATAGELTATCAVTVKETTPITCAQAVEIAQAVSANNEVAAGGKYVIRGYVTALQGTPSSDLAKHDNYSVWMADTKDGDKVFEAYQVAPTDGKTIAAVGDYVEVVGDITKYNKISETVGKTGTIRVISMRGDYTIGAKDSCNYASLADAFTAYNTNAAAGMVTGNVNFLVATDLVEPKNVGIQNPTEYTLTLTVDKAEARTISFSQAADNAGPSGNICIGCDMTLTHESASVESKNIVIDGSFNGSEESYLTIKSVAGCHRLNGPVLIYGNVKNITVKNCQLVAENGTSSSIYPVTIRSQKGTDFAPENITIENNYIEAVKGNSDQGIYFQLTTADMKKPANVTISDNLIKATTRGIFMNGINNATIKGNVIMVNQPSAGMLSYGIWGFGNTEGEFIIEGNSIEQLSTGAAADGSGIYGIVTNAGKWYIRNNYVSGFNVANAAADNIALVGIQGSSNADTVVIEHNTVAMAEQANKMANASAAKVCLIKPVTAKASVKNNLLVSNETGFANALVASPAGIMESNVYCTKSYVGATEETKDFAAYQTAVEPTAKSVVSVAFEDLANGDLDLVAPSDGDANLGVARLADVTTDIYGTERGEFTYAGAYQGTAIQPGPGTDVEDINANSAAIQKIVRNGQVLIIRDGKTYNMMGHQVE